MGEERKSVSCETCLDTGWYGDNGPGRAGNREAIPCDQCERGKDILRHETLSGQTIQVLLRKLNVKEHYEYGLMVEALEFYADPANWSSASKGFAAQYDPEPPLVAVDGGRRARRALEARSLQDKISSLEAEVKNLREQLKGYTGEG
jgi:hypothetical protein